MSRAWGVLNKCSMETIKSSKDGCRLCKLTLLKPEYITWGAARVLPLID